ncbi:glucose-6-phosphate isomerase, partial [Rhodococcus coprophilus]
DGSGSMHEVLMANMFAQAKVLAFGKSAAEIRGEGVAEELVAHKVMRGDRPSTTILAPVLSPSSLGQLIALYEHEVFVEGVVWGIDSFDQWGVELGKEQASVLAPVLGGVGDPGSGDGSTDNLIRTYRRMAKEA